MKHSDDETRRKTDTGKASEASWARRGLLLVSFIFGLLAAYRCSAFLFYRAELRKSIFGCALATAFSLMVLMDNISLGERIMFAGWAICFGTLCWIVLHSAAPGKEETQPVQIAGNDK